MIRIIPFLIFCLSTICSAELRTWTAINGNKVEANYISSSKGIVKLRLKSGKLFEVPKNKLSKDDNEFIDSLFKKGVAVGSGVKKNLSKVVDGNKVEEREGVIYLKDSKIPFTGKAIALHENGQKKMEGNFKNGKKDGLETSWYEDGQKRSEDNFKDGKLDGLSIFWFPNGQKGNEGIYKDGITEGIHKMWHENGQMRAEAKFENGIGSTKFWNSKGESVNSFEETGLK